MSTNLEILKFENKKIEAYSFKSVLLLYTFPTTKQKDKKMEDLNNSTEELYPILVDRVQAMHMEALASLNEELLADVWHHFDLLIEDSKNAEDLIDKLDAYVEVMQALNFLKNLEKDRKKK